MSLIFKNKQTFQNQISPKKAQNQTLCVWFCAFLGLISLGLCLVLCLFRADFWDTNVMPKFICVWSCAFLGLLPLMQKKSFGQISPKKAQNQTLCVWFCAFLGLISLVLCLVLCLVVSGFVPCCVWFCAFLGLLTNSL